MSVKSLKMSSFKTLSYDTSLLIIQKKVDLLIGVLNVVLKLIAQWEHFFADFV